MCPILMSNFCNSGHFLPAVVFIVIVLPDPARARQSDSKYDPIEKLARLVAYKQVLELIADIDFLSSRMKVLDRTRLD